MTRKIFFSLYANLTFVPSCLKRDDPATPSCSLWGIALRSSPPPLLSWWALVHLSDTRCRITPSETFLWSSRDIHRLQATARWSLWFLGQHTHLCHLPRAFYCPSFLWSPLAHFRMFCPACCWGRCFIQCPRRKVKVKSLSRVRLFGTLWTIAYQAPLSMGFPRQEYWSGLPFPSPGDLPNLGVEAKSPTL